MISVCVSHNRVSCVHLAFLRFEFDSVVSSTCSARCGDSRLASIGRLPWSVKNRRMNES